MFYETTAYTRQVTKKLQNKYNNKNYNNTKQTRKRSPRKNEEMLVLCVSSKTITWNDSVHIKEFGKQKQKSKDGTGIMCKGTRLP